MKQFPLNLIQPVKCALVEHIGTASIEISLRPFVFNDVVVETSIHLGNVAIPSVSMAELNGRTFDFSVNPAVGYIDGSIYLDGVHHPVDITQLSFSNSSVKMVGVFVFEFEFEGLADYCNTSFELIAPFESGQ
jgi:hypothetical protein